MPDILHDLPVFAARDAVFDGVASPAGLDAWWTLASSGEAAAGSEWSLDFGPDHRWKAQVVACVRGFSIEWELTEAAEDWRGTRVALRLDERGPKHTDLHFRHAGWREESAHFRSTSFCWAMYLRLLKRFVEHGEVVEYDRRLDV